MDAKRVMGVLSLVGYLNGAFLALPSIAMAAQEPAKEPAQEPEKKADKILLSAPCEAWAKAMKSNEVSSECRATLRLTLDRIFMGSEKIEHEETVIKSVAIDTPEGHSDYIFEAELGSKFKVAWGSYRGGPQTVIVTIRRPDGHIGIVRDVENGMWFENMPSGTYRISVKRFGPHSFTLSTPERWTEYSHTVRTNIEFENPFDFPIHISSDELGGQGWQVDREVAARMKVVVAQLNEVATSKGVVSATDVLNYFEQKEMPVNRHIRLETTQKRADEIAMVEYKREEAENARQFAEAVEASDIRRRHRSALSFSLFGWTGIGVGAAAAGLGVLSHMDITSKTKSKLEAGTTTPDDEAKYRDGINGAKAWMITGAVFSGVGAILVTTGMIKRNRLKKRELALLPIRNGVAFSGRF